MRIDSYSDVRARVAIGDSDMSSARKRHGERIVVIVLLVSEMVSQGGLKQCPSSVMGSRNRNEEQGQPLMTISSAIPPHAL